MREEIHLEKKIRKNVSIRKEANVREKKGGRVRMRTGEKMEKCVREKEKGKRFGKFTVTFTHSHSVIYSH